MGESRGQEGHSRAFRRFGISSLKKQARTSQELLVRIRAFQGKVVPGIAAHPRAWPPVHIRSVEKLAIDFTSISCSLRSLVMKCHANG